MKITIWDWMDAPAEIGDARVFVVGDVHGMSSQFDALFEAMAAEAAGEGDLVLLGDLIDRGPDSLGVLRTAARPAPELGFATKVLLAGNHELMMLSAMTGGPAQLRHLGIWKGNGGSEVLRQVGITPHLADMSAPIVDRVIRQALGPDAMEMIDGAVSHHKVGSVLFVHGGVDPAVPLPLWFARPRFGSAGDDHYAWVRKPFLQHQGPFEGGRLVVHGHSQELHVMDWKGYRRDRAHLLDGWRIGLDGGSFETGIVAGAEFKDGAYRMFFAGP